MRARAHKGDGYQALTYQLMDRYGLCIGGSRLREALGFESAAEFGRAARGGKLNLPFFSMPGRRGRFCLAPEVAQWLLRRNDGVKGLEEAPSHLPPVNPGAPQSASALRQASRLKGRWTTDRRTRTEIRHDTRRRVALLDDQLDHDVDLDEQHVEELCRARRITLGDLE